MVIAQINTSFKQWLFLHWNAIKAILQVSLWLIFLRLVLRLGITSQVVVPLGLDGGMYWWRHLTGLLTFNHLFQLLLSALIWIWIWGRWLVFALINLFQLLGSESVLDNWTNEGICNSPLNVFGFEISLELLKHGHGWFLAKSSHTYISSGCTNKLFSRISDLSDWPKCFLMLGSKWL